MQQENYILDFKIDSLVFLHTHVKESLFRKVCSILLLVWRLIVAVFAVHNRTESTNMLLMKQPNFTTSQLHKDSIAS